MADGNEERISEYVDRTGFANDTKFVLEHLNTVFEAFKKLNEIKVGLGKVEGLADLTKLSKEAAAEIDKISKSNTALSESTKKTFEGLNQYNGAFVTLNTSIQENIKKQNEYKQRLSEITKELKNLRQQQELISNTPGNDEAKNQIDARIQALSEEQAQTKLLNQELTRFTNTQIKNMQALPDTLKQMRTELDSLRNIRDTELKVGSEDFEIAQKRIVALNDAIKKEEFAGGDFQRQVGNYHGAAKIIVDSLSEVEKKIDDLKVKQQGLQNLTQVKGFHDRGENDALKQTTAQIGFLTDQAKSLQAVTNNPQFLNIAGKVGDTNKELRFFTQRLIELENSGQKNTKVYADLQARLAQLTDQVGDTRAEIKALSSDSRSFDLFAGSVNFAADVFQTAAGAAGLLFNSEEDVARITKTLIAITTLSNGVKGIANELTTKGTAANKAYAFVQGLVATSFDKSAASATRFKAALGLLGIAVTVVGAIVVALAAMDKKMSETRLAQEALNDSINGSQDAYVNAVQQVTSLRNNINLAKEGFISKKDVVKQYNKTIGKTTGEVKNLDEAEQALAKNAEAYIQFTLLKAAANFALGEAAKQAFEVQRQIDESTRGNTSADDRISAGLAGANAQKAARLAGKTGEEQGKAYTDAFNEALGKGKAGKELKQKEQFTKIADDLLKQAAAISKEFKFDFFGDGADKDAQKLLEEQRKAALELLKSRQQAIIEENKKIADANIFFAGTRIAALEKIAAAEQTILASQAAYDLTQTKGNADAKTKIEEEFARDKLKINEELRTKSNLIKSSEIIDFNKVMDAQKAELDAISDALNAAQAKRDLEQIEIIKTNLDRQLGVIQAGADHELATLNKKYEKGKISKQKFEDEKKRIEAVAIRDSLLAQIAYQEKLLKLPSVTTAQTEEALKQLAKLKKELSGLDLEDSTNKVKKNLNEITKFLSTVGDVYNQILSIVSGALDAAATAQKNRIQDEIDALDAKTAKEIESIDKTTTNKEEAENKIAVLQARNAQRKQQLEFQQRQIDIRRAQFEKAANIGRIAIEGALSVVHQLGSGDPFTAIPRAIAAGALAAAQLAIAIATPIPKFKHGKTSSNKYEGFAVVGDGGVSELIERADGSMEVTPNKSTVTWVGKDDIIHPDADRAFNSAMRGTDRMISGREVIMVDSNNDQLAGEIRGMRKDIVTAIKNKRENHIYVESPIKMWMKSGDSWTNFINRM